MKEQSTRRFAALAPLLLDMAAPVLSYYLLHFLLGLDPVLALSAGALVAGVRTAVRSVRERRINAFSLMMVVMLGATLALVFVTGDGRLVLAKSAVMPFVGGLYGLATTFFGRTLIYDVGQPFVTRGDPARVAAWRECWARDPEFVRRIKLLNVLWGIGFVLSAVLRVVVVYRVPLDVAVLAGQIPTVAMLVVMAVSTWALGGPVRKALAGRVSAPASPGLPAVAA
ncbi:hypothetical protein M8C13_31820 [Crossiella sp. SN42]|uniref:VC0807 family protein n=1 Tax=Crossiella sp. SN42 TaxID=2944808 RepID=UPI00207C2158|nr:VC0807 family protein [Crossiella sp. SN42]MCO1580355.1 hypothetical protein [Crossiella sp. SN42]